MAKEATQQRSRKFARRGFAELSIATLPIGRPVLSLASSRYIFDRRGSTVTSDQL